MDKSDYIYLYIHTNISVYMFHEIYFEIRCRTGGHLENQTEKDTERSIVALLKAL